MAAHRQNKKAKAMYQLYLAGHSLAQVAKAFGVTRQSVYGMFGDRGWKTRPNPTPLPFVVFEERKYTRRVVGYYGCTNGKRGYLHRHVWQSAHGPIPKGYDIHHKNFDKTDNRLENLELIEKAEHARRYPGRRNQHTIRKRK